MSIVEDAIWAPCPTTARGQPTPLSADAKGQRIAYASNKSIFLRSIDNPALSTEYKGHPVHTTVARFSPSGFYVASGDVAGTVRVWDCVGEGATKGEHSIFSGRIHDLAWDGDSRRIIAVGNGKQRFGHCITFDSGNSVGEVTGHSSVVNSVSIRQQRPLRAATASDDSSLVFYHGAPFKFNACLRDQHIGFVYGVAFSPDGASLVSVGADRRIWLYDGKTGEPQREIGQGEHKGSIFGVSWAGDSRKLATASADQTVKIWDVEAGKIVQNWKLGGEDASSVPHQQVGIVWPAARSDGVLISLGLNGDLSYLVEGQQKPCRIVQGHQKSITTIFMPHGPPQTDQTLWTGSYDGRVCRWSLNDATGETVPGEGHSNQVVGIVESPDARGKILSVGWDDFFRVIDAEAKQYTSTATHLAAQPRAIASLGTGTVALLTAQGVQVYKNGTEKVGEFPIKATPLSIATMQAGSGEACVIAVGAEDRILRILTINFPSAKIELLLELSTSPAAVTALAFSPDGKYLAAGDSNGKIFVHSVQEGYKLVTDRWSGHTARVTSISWNKESTHAASGSLDTNVFVWNLSAPGKRVKRLNAHKDGVNGVVWASQVNKIFSIGADAAVKVWAVDSK